MKFFIIVLFAALVLTARSTITTGKTNEFCQFCQIFCFDLNFAIIEISSISVNCQSISMFANDNCDDHSWLFDIIADGTTTETTEKTNDSSSTSTSSVTILSTDPVPPKVQGVERTPENKTKEIVTTPDPISRLVWTIENPLQTRVQIFSSFSKLPSDPKANVNNNTEPARVNSTGINKTSPLSPTRFVSNRSLTRINFPFSRF